MTGVQRVRAEFGTHTKQFEEGGYVAIGWIPSVDLTQIQSGDTLCPPSASQERLGAKPWLVRV